MAKKMTNVQLMEMLQAQNEKLAKLEAMLAAEKSAREVVESKIEAAESAAVEAERKRKDAEATAKEFKERLEAKEAETPAAQFDASIKCNFDFTVYAVPELGRWKTVRGDVKITELVSISTADLYTVDLEFDTPIRYKRCLGQFGPHLQFAEYVQQRPRWIRREKTAEELMVEIKHRFANQQFKNTLPKYEFPSDAQRIKRALPPVPQIAKQPSKPNNAKSGGNKRSPKGALAAYMTAFDTTDWCEFTSIVYSEKLSNWRKVQKDGKTFAAVQIKSVGYTIECGEKALIAAGIDPATVKKSGGRYYHTVDTPAQVLAFCRAQ